MSSLCSAHVYITYEKTKRKIPLEISRGLKWENKTYKLNRSIYVQPTIFSSSSSRGFLLAHSDFPGELGRFKAVDYNREVKIREKDRFLTWQGMPLNQSVHVCFTVSLLREVDDRNNHNIVFSLLC